MDTTLITRPGLSMLSTPTPTLSRLAAGIALSLMPLASIGAACGNIELHAHRGSPSHPENSIRGAVHALGAGYDAAEIDIQLLNDGRWVLHHDAMTGRTIRSAALRPTLMMSSKDWRASRHIDRQGRASNERAPFLEDLLKATEKSPTDKALHIEIKGVYQCQHVLNAVSIVDRAMPAGNWYFSSVDMPTLQCIRANYPNIYLGLVVAPENDRTSDNYKAVSSAIALFGQKAVQLKQKAEAAYEQNLGRQHLSAQGVKNVRQLLGANSGIHLDAATLIDRPEVLGAAQNLGMTVMTYHAGGDTNHANLVASLKRSTGNAPDALIIDGDPGAMCRRL